MARIPDLHSRLKEGPKATFAATLFHPGSDRIWLDGQVTTTSTLGTARWGVVI